MKIIILIIIFVFKFSTLKDSVFIEPCRLKAASDKDEKICEEIRNKYFKSIGSFQNLGPAQVSSPLL